MFNCFNKSPNRVPRATAIVSCLNTKQKNNHKEYSKEQTCPFSDRSSSQENGNVLPTREKVLRRFVQPKK
jgi:hypothetical protein